MVQAVERSLKRLGTDYVDLYWLHMWDSMTPVEEVMRAFDDLVRAGKVLYVGISDTPSWVIARADMLAELRGWSRVAALQFPYSVSSRDPERELLPMARALGLTVTAWGVIGGGVLTGKYTSRPDEPHRYDSASERAQRVAETVVAVADELARSPAQVAIDWVRQQSNSIIPIIGARSSEQMTEDLGALDFTLGPGQLRRLGEAAPIDLGFPHTFLSSSDVQELIFGQTLPLIDSRETQLTSTVPA
jgi:aryl-alcohol dehydrogenase-like predicted oxidoreductase